MVINGTWVVISATLLVFCFLVSLRLMYIKGYRAGARKVLGEWKQTLREIGDGKNE